MGGKPNLYVLAGVNGAGKSSIGGRVLKKLGLDWYNPDSLARLLRQEHGMAQEQANVEAWQEGMAQLDAALAQKMPFAFETTLGGNAVREKRPRSVKEGRRKKPTKCQRLRHNQRFSPYSLRRLSPSHTLSCRH